MSMKILYFSIGKNRLQVVIQLAEKAEKLSGNGYVSTGLGCRVPGKKIELLSG